MDWETSISHLDEDGNLDVRGVPLSKLSQQSFVANLYFILTGLTANRNVEKLLNVLLTLSIDHGIGPVSTMNARIAASADVPLPQALIAALSTFGHAHGAATEDAAHWLKTHADASQSAKEAVRDALLRGKIPGFGHAVLKKDHRADLLINTARKLKLSGKHCAYALDTARELESQKGKTIPLNIDGAIAAVALDLGIGADVTSGLFLIGRLPGLLAHISEEKSQKNGLRRLPVDTT